MEIVYKKLLYSFEKFYCNSCYYGYKILFIFEIFCFHKKCNTFHHHSPTLFSSYLAQHNTSVGDGLTHIIKKKI